MKFVSSVITTFFVVTIFFMSTACEGIFSGIYDTPDIADPEPVSDDTIIDDQPLYGFKSSEKYSGVIYLNTNNYNEWIYLNLSDKTVEHLEIPTTLTQEWDGVSGITYQKISFNPTEYQKQDFVKTDPQPEPEKWHFAIHHFDVKTNNAEVYESEYTSLDQLPDNSSAFSDAEFSTDVFTDNQCIVDRSQMLSYYIGYQNVKCNLVMSNWATMDFSTPPPVYSSSGKVYILKFQDNTSCAIILDSYMNESGSKGYLTMSYIYPY